MLKRHSRLLLALLAIAGLYLLAFAVMFMGHHGPATCSTWWPV